MFRLQQNTDGTVSTTLVNSSGDTIEIGDTETVTLQLTEMLGDNAAYLTKVCTVSDDVVSAAIDAAGLPYPGIWNGEFIVKDADGVAQHRAKFYLEAEGTILDESGTFSNRPMTIAEVRLGLRDKSAVDNYLLDDVMFTDTEIAWAIRRPIEEWNETSPPVGRYTPSTFPYRYHWLDGIAAELYRMAAQHSARNELRYSAGGLSVDDEAQYKDYAEMSEMFRNEWRSWMMRQKRSTNVQNAFRTTNIPIFGQTRQGNNRW